MGQRIVLTGGPGAGKTTVLEVLGRMGFAVASDVARDIIRERLSSGLSPRPPLADFGREMLKRDLAHYDEAYREGRTTFFERGVADSVAFLYGQGAMSYPEVRRHVRRYRYDAVFVLPPWQEIYTTDSERDQTFEESVRVFGKVVEWYRELGYAVNEVPIGKATDRVRYILERCGTAGRVASGG